MEFKYLNDESINSKATADDTEQYLLVDSATGKVSRQTKSGLLSQLLGASLEIEGDTTIETPNTYLYTGEDDAEWTIEDGIPTIAIFNDSEYEIQLSGTLHPSVVSTVYPSTTLTLRWVGGAYVAF